MDNVEMIVKNIVKKLAEENSLGNVSIANKSSDNKYNVEYPLSKNAKNLLKSKSGKSFDDITYEGLISGKLNGDDLKTNAETLRMQAQIARNDGKFQFAENLERAAEMVSIPDDEVLRIYNLLRPNRTDKKTLLENAKMLREKYNAVNIAKLIENAAEVYEKRGIVTR